MAATALDADLPEMMAAEVQAESQPWTSYRPARRWLFLGILFLALLCSMTDRYLMSVLLEPIRLEFGASDTVMGALTGFAFAAFYALLGLPIARWADRGDRRLIISLALAAWSVMSALCGLARSVPALALARIGVGVGEAGASPPAMSLVADYFPPSQRGRAVAMLVLASTFGIVIAYSAGAAIAATHGWRAAFLWLSLPGIPLAILAYFGLDEPRRRGGRNSGATSGEALATTVKALLGKRSLVYVMLGSALYMMVVAGAFLWIPAYMQRVMRLDLASQGAIYGLASMVIPIAGTTVGGVVTDRLAKRSIKWLAWLPALGVAIAFPFYELMFITNSFVMFIGYSLAAGLALAMAIPSVTALILAVSGAHRRSFAFALYGLLGSLIGAGGGPLLTGALSDNLSASHGVDGLRYALMIVTALLGLCAILYAAAARWIARDLEA
jgi:predicted MFS family arabinose efflux permease